MLQRLYSCVFVPARTLNYITWKSIWPATNANNMNEAKKLYWGMSIEAISEVIWKLGPVVPVSDELIEKMPTLSALLQKNFFDEKTWEENVPDKKFFVGKQKDILYLDKGVVVDGQNVTAFTNLPQLFASMFFVVLFSQLADEGNAKGQFSFFPDQPKKNSDYFEKKTKGDKKAKAIHPVYLKDPYGNAGNVTGHWLFHQRVFIKNRTQTGKKHQLSFCDFVCGILCPSSLSGANHRRP